MLEQLAAIIWAQFRITRNHFPRTSFGTVLSWSFSLLWYMVFTAMALSAARAIEQAEFSYLPLGLSIGLLAIFAYMELVPLVTMSGGWSLQLDRLKAFPIGGRTLFLIELALRLRSAPEMLILLAGIWLGLMLRPDIGLLSPLALLLLVPFSLLLQLAIRDFVLHSFSRSRFREILTVLFLGLALLPQVLVRERTLTFLKPYLLAVANGRATPWHLAAMLSMGKGRISGIAGLLGWNLLGLVLAWWQFRKSIRQEGGLRADSSALKGEPHRDWLAAATKRLSDPIAVLLDKELRTLTRMPRFRILYGMACLFSFLVFLPLAIEAGRDSFFAHNATPLTGLYGLLVLSDALLLNIFGFDRAAAQFYFAEPTSIRDVIIAKNIAAVLLIAVQSTVAPLLLTACGMPVSATSVAAGFLSSAMVTVFLMSAGNLLSVFLPRPVDPRSALRKQGSAKMQMWLLGCTAGTSALVGFAFLGRWATDRDWVLLGVLGFELVAGMVVYPIALQTAVERARTCREEIVSRLSKNAAPLGSD